MSDDVRSSINSSNEDINTGTFNFEIEELDDAEYQIPVVENPPTLESILNESEDNISLNEDNDSVNWSQGIHSNSALCIDGGSETLSLASQRSRNSSEKKGTTSTSFLRHVLLKGISSQITSATERVNAGTPTCMTVSSMVAIGTSHGYILVFDNRQALRWCLCSPDEDQGSVSSLCFNFDSTRLLVGFARGHILMFDLTNGKLIRTLTDVHTPATAVLSVKFTDSSTLALCSDSGGSVFELNFKRTLGVRGCDSKCLFSGSRGEVCVIQPLLLNQFISHPLQGIILVAMATLSKVIVISIRPKMRVVLVRALPPNSTVLPMLSWQFVVIQMGGSGKVVDPVLVYAKENSINFFQVSVDGDGKLRVTALQKLVVNYTILSLHWLNSWTLAVIDISERLHLLDVHTHEELENLDISNIGLVYESSHFKGIFTGGNVSKAMALAGEKACYNTVVSHGNQILLLGAKSVHVMNIRPWTERLNYLVKQKKYLTALSLGLSFYEDPKAAVGLKGTREKRIEATKAKIIQILEQFIDDMENPVEDIPACIQYAVSIRHLDIIFNKLWESVYIDPVTKTIYLESLEPFILNDQIICIPPAILQQFVNCYEQTGKLQALEACIVHFDIGSLDIHQVVQICWLHGLYDAIIYIHNKALNDYITPIHELVPILQKAIAEGQEMTAKQIELGNKLLVYISFCLAGRGYPIGEVPKDSVQSVKYEVFKCLTSVHSKNADDNELPYPFLRTFVHFDTREFLNVVSLAFTEPEFTSELGLRQRQRLIDLLLQIMVNSPGFSENEIGAFFTFLARQLSKSSSDLQVDKQLFQKVFEYLTSPSMTHREERQQALLELLRADALQDYSKENVLNLASNAKFFRVCEYIYEQSGEWDKVLLCYLQDPMRRPQVFSFLRNILLLYKNSKDMEKILDIISSNIEDLLELDVTNTCSIISAYRMDKLDELLESLVGKEKLQLALLSTLLYHKPSDANSDNDPEIACKYFSTFIELICKTDPDSVVDELRNNCDLYEAKELVPLVQRYDHKQAEAYLLECEQNFKGAFQVLSDKLKEELSRKNEAEVDGLVTEIIGIIQRSQIAYNEAQRQELWLALLDIFLACQNSLSEKEKTRIIAKILVGTAGNANASGILEYLLNNRKDLKVTVWRNSEFSNSSHFTHGETFL
ncbi:UNVERIFIED_CONTAM: hypothetical protein PYX00_008218 [Menopon gallinae]|uniref:Vacuolar protein sorting-associated protein 8 central domain-containing protein n=1 Tax=Menopon gallinae TaxID=328185 RepID=A0AAW2HMR7_9NEOP